MFRCVIWGVGMDYDKYINLIHYQEIEGRVQIAGVTGASTIYTKLDGYPFINKSNMCDFEFDLLIIMSEKYFFEIRQEALDMGISDEKIIRGVVFQIPKLDIEKYVQIKRNTPTIFSNNCWGGVIYRRLGLPFLSPTINMFFEDEDYIKLLQEPEKYMEQELMLQEWRYHEISKLNYPVVSCGDIRMHFNHTESFEEAINDWNSRKRKIVWDNLFVMMHTEKREIAEEFSKLPYRNKICFVPTEMDVDSSLCIPFKAGTGYPFWKVVNNSALGELKYYDILDLLCEGANKKRVL